MSKVIIKNASELRNFIGKALPWMRDTGKSKHLRKIEDYPKSKGKSVIIWYGCPFSDSIEKLRVTVNLGVHPHGFISDPKSIQDTENELKIALACMNGKVNQKKTVAVKEPVTVEPIEVAEVVEAVEVM